MQNRSSDSLIAIIESLVAELHPGARPPAVGLDANLERDLALDSLARVELLHRIERAFDVRLPEDTLASAETARDLAAALARAGHAELASTPPAAVVTASDAAGLPETATTLVEALDWHVRLHPDRVHLTVLEPEGAPVEVSYRRLAEMGGRIAAGLRACGIGPGESVALMLPTSPEYFYTFTGILMAGAVPVPIYPPVRVAGIEEHVRRHSGLLANALAVMLVTTREAAGVARLLTARVDSLRAIVTPEALLAETPGPTHRARAEDTAFLQYTSGSTGNPKGVVLTHANLLANIRAMGVATGVTASDVFVSWLPLYHDMGLIGAWMGSLYHGMPLVVMSPLSFLARPERWLWAIHRYRGSVSAGPNFAYELAARRIDERDIEGLDLSSWRWAFNGAEPVGEGTMLRFAERFAPHGFRAEAVAPVYGLAECSVGLTFPAAGRGLFVDAIRRDRLAHDGVAEPTGAPDALRVVACGRPLADHELRIVDPAGNVLGERREGRIEFRGPSATRGYFRNPDETTRLRHGEWLDTGDMGYIAGGDLFITGRAKDIIIRGGRNIHPAELEAAIGALPGARAGGVAVFGASDRAAGTERLVVLVETARVDPHERAELEARARSVAVEVLGAPADEIVLAPPRTVLKTSSGKIRRAATRELYERGRLGTRAPAAWRQLVRLVAGTLVRRIAGFGFALWAWLMVLLIAPATWLLVACVPGRGARWAIVHRAARLLLGATAGRVVVRGTVGAARPLVLVANHSSYLDGLVLAAVLERPAAFIAKREFATMPIAGRFLMRLGCEFVERFDREQSAADANRLVERVRAGASIVVFPEGTFIAAGGLRTFRLGAFLAAAGAGVPVLPIAIAGTRAILPAGRWLPRRHRIEVTIGTPLRASTADWHGALALRDEAQAMIARGCGESVI